MPTHIRTYMHLDVKSRSPNTRVQLQKNRRKWRGGETAKWHDGEEKEVGKLLRSGKIPLRTRLIFVRERHRKRETSKSRTYVSRRWFKSSRSTIAFKFKGGNDTLSNGTLRSRGRSRPLFSVSPWLSGKTLSAKLFDYTFERKIWRTSKRNGEEMRP